MPLILRLLLYHLAISQRFRDDRIETDEPASGCCLLEAVA